MTGDLVNISLPGEYAPALAWLESLGSPHDVTLVPGNHDAYVWAAARFPQSHWGALPERRRRRRTDGDRPIFRFCAGAARSR